MHQELIYTYRLLLGRCSDKIFSELFQPGVRDRFQQDFQLGQTITQNWMEFLLFCHKWHTIESFDFILMLQDMSAFSLVWKMAKFTRVEDGQVKPR